MAAASAEKGTPPKVSDDIFKTVRQDVLDGNEAHIEEHITALITTGVDARDILDKGRIAAMEFIGPRFKAGELFIPEVLLSSRAMNRGHSVLVPHLSEDTDRHSGKILLGTVKGDLHDIGKNMVSTCRELAGRHQSVQHSAPAAESKDPQDRANPPGLSVLPGSGFREQSRADRRPGRF